MSSFESASSGTLTAVDPRATAGRLVPYFYAGTLFVSALLLFSIQPMYFSRRRYWRVTATRMFWDDFCRRAAPRCCILR